MNLGVIYTVLTSPELVFQKHTGLPAGCHLGCSFVGAPFQTFSKRIRAFPLAMSSASDISIHFHFRAEVRADGPQPGAGAAGLEDEW
jgi:hypothetical protein